MSEHLDDISVAAPRVRPRRVPEPHEHFVHIPPRIWKLLLFGGAGVWLFSAAITEITDDDILVPTVIIVGSFLVPVVMAAFALSRRRDGYLTTEEVTLGFLAAGTLAVVVTALLETYLLPAATGTFVGVGVIEELGKVAVLVVVAHQVHHREPRDGMVLGAVVGAGFAAFESAGYALQTMLANIHGHTVINILETQAFRGVLAPFGHITWTALIGGALFASTRSGRFVFSPRLGWTLVGVAALHAIWDQSYGWAIMFTRGILEGSWHIVWPNAQTWYGPPTSEAMIWFNVSYDTLLVLNALVGTAWIIYEWRVYGRWRADAAAGASAGTDVASAA